MELRDEAMSLLRAISPYANDIWYKSTLPHAIGWLAEHDERLLAFSVKQVSGYVAQMIEESIEE